MSNGRFYDGKRKVYCRAELWKTIADLLTIKSGKKVAIKMVRDSYKKWYGSTFVTTMSFSDFVQKLFAAGG